MSPPVVVLACEPDPLRRPQRPGNQLAFSRSLEPSRQFTLENHREPSCAFTMHWPNAELSRLRVGNVPQPAGRLKQKLYCFCAEAVDDRDLLWKPPENPPYVRSAASAVTLAVSLSGSTENDGVVIPSGGERRSRSPESRALGFLFIARTQCLSAALGMTVVVL